MVLKLAGPLNNLFENYNTNNKQAAIIQKNANSPVICKKKNSNFAVFFNRCISGIWEEKHQKQVPNLV
jgi:hypothetical protein